MTLPGPGSSTEDPTAAAFLSRGPTASVACDKGTSSPGWKGKRIQVRDMEKVSMAWERLWYLPCQGHTWYLDHLLTKPSPLPILLPGRETSQTELVPVPKYSTGCLKISALTFFYLSFVCVCVAFPPSLCPESTC